MRDDYTLSRACALGSSLEWVLNRITAACVPVVVLWEDDARKTLCGPWVSMGRYIGTIEGYTQYVVFDYEILEGMTPADRNVVIHIKPRGWKEEEWKK